MFTPPSTAGGTTDPRRVPNRGGRGRGSGRGRGRGGGRRLSLVSGRKSMEQAASLFQALKSAEAQAADEEAARLSREASRQAQAQQEAVLDSVEVPADDASGPAGAGAGGGGGAGAGNNNNNNNNNN